MSEGPTLVKFFYSWAQEGVGADGLPLYRQKLMIRKDRPPQLSLTFEATEADIENPEFEQSYKMFERENRGRETISAEGYPLAMWVAMQANEVMMCADREIYTVQDLAKVARRDPATIPPEIFELAQRAAVMVELQKETGHYEGIIAHLKDINLVLDEQVKELRATVEGQKAVIKALKREAAA